jgi:hypothetical protein
MNKRHPAILTIAAIGLLTIVNSLVLVRDNVSAARLSAASIPQRISYQGRLTDVDGNPLDGTYNMTFRLYDHPTAGTLCWTESQDVTVKYGVFNILLGDITPIESTCFSGPDLYLGVEVGSDGEMTPRRRVVSVGYAYRAEESSTADYASSAGNADTADYASSAGTADYASSAGNADTVDGKHADDFAAIDHVHTDPPYFDNANRYVDSSNGTVIDTVTGLIWLKDANCLGVLNYAAANNAAAGLKNGDCGLSDNSSPGDWRLPTKQEWEETISRALDLGCTYPALVNTGGMGCYADGPQAFTGVRSDFYWSSTADANSTSNAWAVHLTAGSVGSYGKASGAAYVWPVRGGQ